MEINGLLVKYMRENNCELTNGWRRMYHDEDMNEWFVMEKFSVQGKWFFVDSFEDTDDGLVYALECLSGDVDDDEE